MSTQLAEVHQTAEQTTPIENQRAGSQTSASADYAQTQTSAEHQVVHEITLFAEPVFGLGAFTVTNSLINSWLAVVIIIGLVLALKKRIKKVPDKAQGFAEMVVEGALNMADSVTNERQKTLKIFPKKNF